jgi:very-short-patch-repair endonuclease
MKFKTIYNKRGNIKISQGEQECMKHFSDNAIEYKKQVRIPNFGRYRFDFEVENDDIQYLIELDGQQHFAFSPYLHKKETKFKKQRTTDIKKTFAAIAKGYCVIRIDYNEKGNILKHLQLAFNDPCVLYVSNKDKYQWLFDAKIRSDWISKYLP